MSFPLLTVIPPVNLRAQETWGAMGCGLRAQEGVSNASAHACSLSRRRELAGAPLEVPVWGEVHCSYAPNTSNSFIFLFCTHFLALAALSALSCVLFRLFFFLSRFPPSFARRGLRSAPFIRGGLSGNFARDGLLNWDFQTHRASQRALSFFRVPLLLIVTDVERSPWTAFRPPRNPPC